MNARYAAQHDQNISYTSTANGGTDTAEITDPSNVRRPITGLTPLCIGQTPIGIIAEYESYRGIPYCYASIYNITNINMQGEFLAAEYAPELACFIAKVGRSGLLRYILLPAERASLPLAAAVNAYNETGGVSKIIWRDGKLFFNAPTCEGGPQPVLKIKVRRSNICIQTETTQEKCSQGNDLLPCNWTAPAQNRKWGD